MLKSLLLYVSSVTALIASANAYAITGPQGGVNSITGQRPFRQEFTNFSQSGAPFDLYVLALQEFTQQNQTELLSFYQVGGIHGYPYKSWDNVNGTQQAGYCTHASILFPSWHRPYVALFEQIIWNFAQSIASTYPASQKAKYQAAAQALRIPYWDWASTPSMPALVNTVTISVNTPNGVETITNPLYNYTFHPQPSASDFPPSQPLSQFHSTVRYPNSAGKSQPNKVNKQLVANGQSIHTLTYQLLASQSNYAPFSNTAYSDGQGGDYNSLENMHNEIHSLVGNGGHMGDVPFAGFDPIFWLHHANVDRLFAIWQALYPNSYTTPEVDAYGTYTNAPGETEDINTPLTPFHSNAGGTLYTSATARSTRSFGYSYPEVVDWGVNATQLSANVRTNVNALYNPTGSISQRALLGRRGILPSPNSMNHQWAVNIRVNKNALNSSFFIHFFLGDIPADSDTWSWASNLVASQSIFTSTHQSENDTSTAPAQTIHGQIPLTHSLMDAVSSGQIIDLKPASVLGILTAQLGWRIQKTDDSVVPVDEVPSLKVYVAGRSVDLPATSDQFPTYGPWTAYRNVTRGKVGGLLAGAPL